MKYSSTRGQSRSLSFSEAVAIGLAPDGGLFLPDPLPHFDGIPAHWEAMGYAELAAAFLAPFAPEISRSEWQSLTRQAYAQFDRAEVAPLVRLRDRLSVLELLCLMIANVHIRIGGFNG